MEIEVKFRVNDFSEIRERLDNRGATRLYSSLERDVYLEPFNAKEALRVRYRDPPREWIITYKRLVPGENQTAIELETHTGPEILEILERVGHKPVFEKVKRREAWKFREVTVNLDEVKGLGKFVEIEYLGDPGNDALERASRELGLDWESRIDTPYVKMLLEKLKKI